MKAVGSKGGRSLSLGFTAGEMTEMDLRPRCSFLPDIFGVASSAVF